MRDDHGEVNERTTVVDTTCVLTSGGAAGFSWVSEAIDPCCGCQIPLGARVDCLVLASTLYRRGGVAEGTKARKVLFGRGVRVEDRMLIGDTVEHDVRPVILYVYGSARYSTDGHCKPGSRIRAWQSDPQTRGKVRWCGITASVRHQQ